MSWKLVRFELQQNAGVSSMTPVSWARVGSDGAIAGPELLVKNVGI